MTSPRSVQAANVSEDGVGALKTGERGGISVIIPTYNEAGFIVGVLETVLAAQPAVREVLVADGRSEDATRALIAQVAARDARVVLIDNPGRIQSAGLNRAVAAADPNSDVLVRLDAHAKYPADFIAHLIRELGATGASSVVVRLRSIGDGCFQRAVAVLSNTVLGTGGAAHRMGMKSEFVDHGHHAAFRREAYENAGGYDESFVANEDADLDHRIRSQGGKIWFAADIVVDYFPRDTPSRLAGQYYRYGIGRAQTVRKSNEIRLRQLIPPAAFSLVALGLVIAPFQPWGIVLPLSYLALMALFSAGHALTTRDPCLLAGAIALPIMHMTWAAGFLRSFLFGPPGRRATPQPETAGSAPL